MSYEDFYHATIPARNIAYLILVVVCFYRLVMYRSWWMWRLGITMIFTLSLPLSAAIAAYPAWVYPLRAIQLFPLLFTALAGLWHIYEDSQGRNKTDYQWRYEKNHSARDTSNHKSNISS